MVVIGPRVKTGHRYQHNELNNLTALAPLCKLTLRVTHFNSLFRKFAEVTSVAVAQQGPVAIEISEDMLHQYHLLKAEDFTGLAQLPWQPSVLPLTALVTAREEQPWKSHPVVDAISDILDRNEQHTFVANAGTLSTGAVQHLVRTEASKILSNGCSTDSCLPATVAAQLAGIKGCIGLSTQESVQKSIGELQSLVSNAAQGHPAVTLLIVASDPEAVAPLLKSVGFQTRITGDVTHLFNDIVCANECHLQQGCAAVVLAPTITGIPQKKQSSTEKLVALPDQVICALKVAGINTSFSSNTAFVNRTLQYLPDDSAASVAAAAFGRRHRQPACQVTSNLCESLPGACEAKAGSLPMLTLLVHTETALCEKYQVFFKGFHQVTGQSDLCAILQKAAAQTLCGNPGPVLVQMPQRVMLSMGGHTADGHEHAIMASAMPLAVPEKPIMPSAREIVVTRVAHTVAKASRPLLIIGLGAAGTKDPLVAQSVLVQLAESFGMAVTTTASAKGLFPETHPLWLSITTARSVAVCTFMEQCDAAIILGAKLGEASSDNYSLALPHDNYYHVDIDVQIPGANFACHPILADAQELAEALLEHAPSKDATRFSQGIQDARSSSDETLPPVERLLKAVQDAVTNLRIQDCVCYVADPEVQPAVCKYLLLDMPGCCLAPTNFSQQSYCIPAMLAATCGAEHTMPLGFLGEPSFLASRDNILLLQASGRPAVAFVISTQVSELVRLYCESLKVQYTTLSAFESLEFQTAVKETLMSPGLTVVHCMDPQSKTAHPAPTNVVLCEQPMRSQQRYFCDEFDMWNFLHSAVIRFGGRAAIVDGLVKHSYEEVGQRVRRLASFAMNNGFKPQEKLGILLPNSHQAIESHYAAAGLRAIALNLNFNLKPAELGFILQDSAPTWIVAHASFGPLLAAALAEPGAQHLEQQLTIVWVESDTNTTHQLQQVPCKSSYLYQDIVSSCAPDVFFPSSVFSLSDGYQMYYTSGTTGMPKGVILSIECVANHAAAAITEFSFQETDVWGHFAPMYHLVDAFGIFCTTYLGGKHVILREWNPRRALHLIETEKVTITNVASTMMSMMLSSAHMEATDLSSLRMASCGGSPLAQAHPNLNPEPINPNPETNLPS